MERVGLQLVADGGDNYLATLTLAAAAEVKLGDAATGAAGNINTLDASQERVADAARTMSMTVDLAAGKITILGGAADATASDAVALGGAAGTAAGGVDTLGDKADEAGKETSGLGEKSKTGASGLDWLKESAIGAARELGGKLLNAAQEAGQAVMRFVGDTINKAGDFEGQMNRFASVTGEALATSGQSLDEFKDLFLSLGRELPVSTAEVQQAAIEMAKGGIEPATIAAGGLRDVLNLAAAGEVGIAEAAEIASKQLGVWVDNAATATEKAAFLKESVDLLAQAANVSTVGVSDLALGLANTGKSADLAGLSFQETVTSMALISSGFSSAADAGTSFKTFLQRLQPATDSQAEAFKTLNLLTSEGKSVFYDATGSFIGMDKAAEILKQSLNGMSEAQRSAALSAAFGSDAIRAAGMLADAGAEGYVNMAAAMAEAGSASVQAARKQQGFNVAMDNMIGSVEAFQITVGSMLLPVLTNIVNAMASGINAITDYAEATAEGNTVLAQAADIMSTGIMPVLAGLTGALAAYALVQFQQAIPAILASLPALATQATAFYANAAAVGAAILPYAVIAGAIAGVVLAYQNFTGKVTDATTALLDSRQWWTDSALAIADYNTQVGESKDALAPYAQEIQALRDQIQLETEALGKRMSLDPEGDYTSEMNHINDLAEALKGSTGRYTDQQQALIDTTAASMTATNQAGLLQTAEQGLGGQTALTTSDIEALGKAIQTTFTQGQEAISAYAVSYSEFAAGVESRSSEFSAKMAELEKQKQEATTKEQRQGIDDQITQLRTAYADQEENAAQSYARQQQAQQQHLGQMLIDYTVAQAQLGNIAKDKAAEITAALEEQYGLQESSTATTFLNMAQSIDQYAADSGASIDTLIGDLQDQQHQAAETQKAMDKYATEYVATQVNNFMDGKSDAENYISALERIPKTVTTEVKTRYTSEGKPDTNNQEATVGGARAEGGPVDAMTPYLVGERGMEIVTPTTAGYVTPTDAIRRALASPAQMGSMSQSTQNTYTQERTFTYAPVYGASVPASPYMDAQIARGYFNT